MVLIFIFLQLALVQSQGEFVIEPSDQQVVIGRNALFHCNTRSSKAYWKVDKVAFEFIERYSHYPEYQYVNSMDNTFFNISLTIFTSVDVNYLTIRCFYAVPSSRIHYSSRVAYLRTVSCLAVPSEELVVTNATFYYNAEVSLIKLSFGLPQSCENLLVNYTLYVEDANGNPVSSKGPVQHIGQWRVEEEVMGGLERDQIYYIQVEASVLEPREKLSKKWHIDTHLNLNLTCYENEDEELTLVVAVVGAVLGTIILSTIVWLGILIASRTKKKCGHEFPAGQVLSEGMVPNPIYDGPMYECIHQQFSKVVRSPTSNDVLLTPNNNPSHTTALHYIVDPNHGNKDPAKNYENMDSASNSASVPSKSKTSKERNKLQLTLHLENPKSAERGVRTRATTMAPKGSACLGKNKDVCSTNLSPFRSRCATAPSTDDNYITLSHIGAIRDEKSGGELSRS